MHLAGYSPLQNITTMLRGSSEDKLLGEFTVRCAGVLAVSAQCLTQSCQGPGGRTSFLADLQPLAHVTVSPVSSKVLRGQASWAASILVWGLYCSIDVVF